VDGPAAGAAGTSPIVSEQHVTNAIVEAVGCPRCADALMRHVREQHGIGEVVQVCFARMRGRGA